MTPLARAGAVGGIVGLTVGSFAGALLGLLGPIGACVLLGIVLAGGGALAGVAIADAEKRSSP